MRQENHKDNGDSIASSNEQLEEHDHIEKL